MGIGFAENDENDHHHKNWGMGFLLVLFPEETTATNTATAIINNNHKIQTSPSSFPGTFLKRSNPVHLLSKAQSTISICALLIFITILLFTLSTIEPSSTTSSHFSPRRHLNSNQFSSNSHSSILLPHALQGMGSLYRRGSKSMNGLIVAHIVESVTVNELRLFIRVFQKSSLASKSDLLFIFPSKSTYFDRTILEENNSFLKLIDHYQELSSNSNSSGGFYGNPFVKLGGKGKENAAETIWGRGIRSNNLNFSTEGSNGTESTQLSYGSVVGFDVDELDPENSLAGFMDHVPMSLRRWACYQMLLGRVRNRFKHVLLVDVKEMLLFGDPLGRVKGMSPESVYLTHSPSSTRHGKRNSEKTGSTHSKSVNSAIVTGGGRGVRRLSNAMLTEIVRTAMQNKKKKKKNPVTEAVLFNQLVSNEFLLKNVNLITSKEAIPELSSLPAGLLSSKHHAETGGGGSKFFTVVRRGNSNFDVNSTVVKHILCSDSSSSLYSDDC